MGYLSLATLMLPQPCLCLAPHFPSPTAEPTPQAGQHTSGLPSTICLLAFTFRVQDQPWRFNDVLAFLGSLLVTLTCDCQVTLKTVKVSRVPPSLLGPCLWPLPSSPPGPARGTISCTFTPGEPRGQKEHTQVPQATCGPLPWASPHSPHPVSHRLQLHEEAVSPRFPEPDTRLPLSSFPDFSGF